MNVLIAGGTGFVGQELGIALTAAGHSVAVLSRSPEKYAGKLAYPAALHSWLDNYRVKPELLRWADAVVNLTGASVSETPWNDQGKKRMRASRLEPAAGLLTSMSELKAERPRAYLQASATGYYGDAGETELTEASRSGSGFLARTCEDWEAKARELCPTDVRMALLRFPPVLGRAQGILKTLDKVYASGWVPSLGTGQQWFSWIHVRDLCGILEQILVDEKVSGPVNVVAPHPVRFEKFHHALVAAKQVRSLGHVPTFAVRLTQGEKATLVLASVRAVPSLMEENGYQFEFSSIEAALGEIYANQCTSGVLWLESKQWLPASISDVWPFFSQASNLEKLTPDWLNFHVVGMNTDEIGQGTLIDYKLKLHGLSLRWRSEILNWQPDRCFVDRQLKGPYKNWYHTHSFAQQAGGTLITDTVQYKLPFGAFGLAALPWVNKDVEQIFAYRTGKIKEEFYDSDTSSF